MEQVIQFFKPSSAGKQQATRGRGVSSNPAGRLDSFERFLDEAVTPLGLNFAEPAPLKTTVQQEVAKTIISRNQSPDIPFELSVNPYRGCEHGCFYCYARPNHSYINLSPGLDFESKLSVKSNAVELLRGELLAKNYVVSPINLGSVTDCYQPIERQYRLTRQILEVLSDCNHPVTIVTKSSLVERDIDLLSNMARRGLVQVFISVTSLDSHLSRKMEPRASAPWSRVKTVKKLAEAGIPVRVLMAPIIPFINEPEIEAIGAAIAKAGAQGFHYTVLRMPFELVELTQQWLQRHFPDRAERVFHRVQDMRGGRNNDPRFKTRMRGEGVWAELIRARVHAVVRRHKLSTSRLTLDCSQFDPTILATHARHSNRLSSKRIQDSAQFELFS
jgi:DNA repair photolyase